MQVDVQLAIPAPLPRVWAAMTDFDHAARDVRGIEALDILERPASGLLGLRWRETRNLFGEAASVEKRITAAEAPVYYQTLASADGFEFISVKRLREENGVVIVTETHLSTPLTWRARLMVIPMRLFFRGVIKKAILQDLEDLKLAAMRDIAAT